MINRITPKEFKTLEKAFNKAQQLNRLIENETDKIAVILRIDGAYDCRLGDAIFEQGTTFEEAFKELGVTVVAEWEA